MPASYDLNECKISLSSFQQPKSIALPDTQATDIQTSEFSYLLTG